MSEQNLDELLAHLPLPLVVLDPQTQVCLFGNPAFTQLLGGVSDLLGKTLNDFSPLTQRSGITADAAFKEIVAHADTDFMQAWTLQTQHGELLETLIRGQWLFYDGRACLLVTLQNITDTVENTNLLINAAQSAQQQNEMRARFLEEISRELRTPLGVIVEALNEALANATEPAQEELFNQAYYEAQNLLVMPQRLKMATEENAASLFLMPNS